MKLETDMDILKKRADLKDNPFTVPEGYFETMKERASHVPDVQLRQESKLLRILVPVLSVAASVAVVLSGMLLFESRRTVQEPRLCSANAGAALSSDEIIEYLIYTGTSVEDINAVGSNN